LKGFINNPLPGLGLGSIAQCFSCINKIVVLQVVACDLDTTGRRLIDEICQIGGYYAGETAESTEQVFSQYVMPYKNPNPGARRSFGIKVVSIGRYRMLKDLESGRILKTKSEISALQEFLDWLKKAKGSKDGVLLVCHEPTRKVLIPLLLEALYRYNLVRVWYISDLICNNTIVSLIVALQTTLFDDS